LEFLVGVAAPVATLSVLMADKAGGLVTEVRVFVSGHGRENILQKNVLGGKEGATAFSGSKGADRGG